jgi:low temperature requirement protein LtrA
MGGHRGHIVERYGLFTVIVLGESVAAATVAISETVRTNANALALLLLATGGLVIVFSLWWIYFDFSTARAPAHGRVSQFVWGYGHYFLFASVATIGVGLTLALECSQNPIR